MTWLWKRKKKWLNDFSQIYDYNLITLRLITQLCTTVCQKKTAPSPDSLPFQGILSNQKSNTLDAAHFPPQRQRQWCVHGRPADAREHGRYLSASDQEAQVSLPHAQLLQPAENHRSATAILWSGKKCVEVEKGCPGEKRRGNGVQHTKKVNSTQKM